MKEIKIAEKKLKIVIKIKVFKKKIKQRYGKKLRLLRKKLKIVMRKN